MKRLIASALVSAICIVSFAQNLRPVQGRVVNEDGAPMPGATITVKGYDASFTTDSNGDFTAEIPYGYNFLTASFTDYIPKTIEVDGSYMIFKLVYDKDAVKRRQEAEAKAEADRIAAAEKARKEAEAKAAAEEAARVKAEKERIAAEERARREAEAKAAAEEAARVKAEKERIAAEERARREAEAQAAAEEAARMKAEKERIAAEEKARKEAQAQAAAEEAARVKAEKERIAAEERARREAEAQAAAEEAARVRAEKERIAAEAKAERQEKNAAKNEAYDAKFKNKGLAHSIEVAYNPEIMEGEMVYQYSGIRSWGTLHPLQATYTISYKFNSFVSLGVGAGFLCNLRSFSIVGDFFDDDAYEDFKEIRYDVPVFINLRTWFCRTGVRPFLNVDAGYNCLSGTIAADAGIGCEFRLSRSCSMHVIAGAAFTPVPYFMYGGFTKGTRFVIHALADKGYKGTLTPSVRLGIDF